MRGIPSFVMHAQHTVRCGSQCVVLIGGSHIGTHWWDAQPFALYSNPTFTSAGGSEDVVHIPHWSPTQCVCPTLPDAANYPPIGAQNL